jgi:hypothetical protein
LLTSWLLVDTAFSTPLELTFKAWAAYAGDTLGSSPSKGMQAYIRRLTAGLPKARPALESLALQMVLTLHTTLTEKDARKWTGEIEIGEGTAPEEEQPENGKDERPAALKGSQTRLRGMVSDCWRLHPESYLARLDSPIQCGCLPGGSAISENGLVQAITSQPEWLGKTETCAWLGTILDISHGLTIILRQSRSALAVC